MLTTCLRSGWRAAFSHGSLALTLWAWNGLLALAAAFATWRWLDAAFAYAPEADKLLERFRLGIVIELLQYDRFSPLSAINGAAIGLLILAAISNPLVSAGLMEVLVTSDERPMLHRFFRGAGHFFWRFARLLVISGIAGLILFLVAAAATRPITTALGESSWERAWLAASLARLSLLALIFVFLAAVNDLARAEVTLSNVEMRGMFRAWLRALRLAVGNFGLVTGIALAYFAVLGVMLIAYAALAGALPAQSAAGILILIVLQQAFMIGRAALRVARGGAAVALCRARLPVAAPVAQPVTNIP